MCHVGYIFDLGLIFTTDTINKMLNCQLEYDNAIWFGFFCLIIIFNAANFQYTEYFPTKLKILYTCYDHTTDTVRDTGVQECIYRYGWKLWINW